MKYLLSILILVLISCNQEGMSDEHRQKIKAEKADRKIKRVTEADILNAAKEKAEEIYNNIETNKYSSIASSDEIRWVSLDDTLANSYDQKMQEAYRYALDNGLKLYDNIEDTGSGEMTFTRPVLVPDTVRGFWVIILSKKEVIKGM